MGHVLLIKFFGLGNVCLPIVVIILFTLLVMIFIYSSRMDYRLQLRIILLLLMAIVYVAQATSVQNLYKKTKPGQDITGKIGAEITTISAIECSTR